MLAVELPQLKHDVRGSGPDAFRTSEEVVLASGPFPGSSL